MTSGDQEELLRLLDAPTTAPAWPPSIGIPSQQRAAVIPYESTPVVGQTALRHVPLQDVAKLEQVMTLVCDTLIGLEGVCVLSSHMTYPDT